MESNDRDIVAVNVSDKIVITNDGEILPITNMLDEFGDECLHADEALAVVAGPDKSGYWWSIALEDYIANGSH